MSDPQQPQNWQWPQQGGQPQAGGQPWQGAQPGGQPWQGAQPGGQPWQGAQPGGQPWQGAQPGGQPWPAQPQAGYQVPPGTPGYGQAVRRPRRWLAPLIIVVALVAAGIGGFVAFHKASNTSKGSITLPATLLNLQKNTSAGANHLARALMRGEATNSHGRLKNVKAGVYGSPSAAWFAIAGGGICGTCFAKSPSALESGLTNSGYTNVRSYPAGPKGGSLACGLKSANATTLLHCTWVDKTTAGDILFAGGAASDLADAAAKTNQVRAVIEH
jgi:hypothetical protein